MFNPLAHFKKLHHDKCILGSSNFAPCECEYFCYSKQFLPSYLFAIPPTLEFVFKTDAPSPTPMFIDKIELRRLTGPHWPDEDGYYAYVKEIK